MIIKQECRTSDEAVIRSVRRLHLEMRGAVTKSSCFSDVQRVSQLANTTSRGDVFSAKRRPRLGFPESHEPEDSKFLGLRITYTTSLLVLSTDLRALPFSMMNVLPLRYK